MSLTEDLHSQTSEELPGHCDTAILQKIYNSQTSGELPGHCDTVALWTMSLTEDLQ